ncbi:hypothetical protein NQ314_014344 [Rhamnusium bicolor]|uniref:Uncharacterized protein n=1 Tax=Rhamnusium bicolor TaxID=1586634 RepID=A0AAV8X2U8_9CUCU|nr:hypothetical protein NQ314_014344 [Rhamnusium bicolor]
MQGQEGLSGSSDHRLALIHEMSAHNFDLIRFASYRTATKLRFIQKKVSLHAVDIWNVIEAFREQGLHALEPSQELSVARLETLLCSLYHSLNKRAPPTQQAHVDVCSSLLLNWILAAYATVNTPGSTEETETLNTQSQREDNLHNQDASTSNIDLINDSIKIQEQNKTAGSFNNITRPERKETINKNKEGENKMPKKVRTKRKQEDVEEETYKMFKDMYESRKTCDEFALLGRSCDNVGKIRVFSIKVALATLCAGKLMDKLRYIFSQISDSNGLLLQWRFNEYLQEVLALPAAVYESPTFNYTDSLANSIFSPLSIQFNVMLAREKISQDFVIVVKNVHIIHCVRIVFGEAVFLHRIHWIIKLKNMLHFHPAKLLDSL